MSAELQLDNRCQHKTTDGRRCSMPRVDGHPSLCYEHRRQELQPGTDPETVAAELLGSIEDFRTAIAVNHALGRLFVLLARNRIPPRNAAILAYICQLLLNSLPAVEDQIGRTQGLSGWQRTMRHALQNLHRSKASELANATSQRGLPANLAPSEQENSLRDGETFTPARNLNAQSRIPKKGGGQSG